ncbi:MAG: hypothetical protein [Bacteriophage sp.]|nr:MAG: hypothetical protein [Bacteriophage sp.]
MAKFKSTLHIGEPNDLSSCQGKLLLSVLLWLRTRDSNGHRWLGLESLVELLVPYNVDMKLGLSTPDLQAGRLVSSTGEIWKVDGPGKFLWDSRSFERELDLDVYGGLHLSYKVHECWLEWALQLGMLMLADAGKPWTRQQAGQFSQTIGGFEVADFLR